MMGNVINFPEPNDVKYYISGDKKALAVVDGDLAIGIDDGEPFIEINGNTRVFDRETLSKILWAAAYLLDSEERWAADSYVGRDYDKEKKVILDDSLFVFNKPLFVFGETTIETEWIHKSGEKFPFERVSKPKDKLKNTDGLDNIE